MSDMLEVFSLTGKEAGRPVQSVGCTAPGVVAGAMKCSVTEHATDNTTTVSWASSDIVNITDKAKDDMQVAGVCSCQRRFAL